MKKRIIPTPNSCKLSDKYLLFHPITFNDNTFNDAVITNKKD